jgi:hypothetical protein
MGLRPAGRSGTIVAGLLPERPGAPFLMVYADRRVRGVHREEGRVEALSTLTTEEWERL